MQMVLNGHISRGKKPVHWSPSSGTALAEAELEYPDNHKSKSIYVSFPITSVPDSCPEMLKGALDGAAIAVWTTTPWTMPANLAVGVKEDLDYSVVQACLCCCLTSEHLPLGTHRNDVFFLSRCSSFWGGLSIP